MVDLSEMDRHLETVKWFLDDLTPETVDLGSLAIASCTASAGILKGVVSLIHNRAILDLEICPLYAKLCSNLHEELPTFPPEEADGEEIEFIPLLLERCQEVIDGDDEACARLERNTAALDQAMKRTEKEAYFKQRRVGNARLIGELLKQKMISEKAVHSIIERLLETDSEGRPTVQNVQALSELLRAIGRQLDESHVSRRKLDAYINRLNVMAVDFVSALGVWFSVQSIVKWRANNWVTHAVMTAIHSESEESLSDTNNEDDVLKRKTVRLLEEYFSDINVDKALRSVEELDSPSYHSQVVKEAISVGLEKCPDQVLWLLEHLFAKHVITANDVADGCVSYGSLMDGIKDPSAPRRFGEIMGKLVLGGGLDFGVVEEVLKRSEHEYSRKAMFNAAFRIVNFSLSPAAQAVLNAQASEIKACRLCCGLP